MTPTAIAVICFIAFAISIFISFKTKANTGLIAMAFAYLIGCFIMKLRVSEVISLFPLKIMFLLFSVCLFYGYAIQNGTMHLLADHIIYRFQKKTKLIPFILYMLSFLLAVLGASAPAISSFMAPVCLLIAEQMGIHYFIILILISLGSAAGTLVPWGQAGIIIRGILEDSAYADLAASLPLKICFNMFITGLLGLTAVYFIFKGYKAKSFTVSKPAKFNAIQKKTLCLLLIVLSLVLLPSIINTLDPAIDLSFFSRVMDIQMLSIVGAVICCLMKLGNEKEVILHYVPWNTIVLVSGICMLFGIVTKTGFFDSLTGIFNAQLSATAICVILVILCGFMSFFSGAMSVVVPLILPIVIELCVNGGYPLVSLASSMAIGAIMTCTSPFSTAGSFILSCLPDASDQDKVFNRQFLLTCLLFIIPIILAATGFYGLLG